MCVVEENAKRGWWERVKIETGELRRVTVKVTFKLRSER